MSHIIFGGMYISYIINEISVDTNQEFNTSSYVGADGSRTTYVSRDARTLSFKSLCLSTQESKHNRGHRINDYIHLAKTYNKKSQVLTSPSQSNIDGNYICTKMDYKEDTQGNYEIDWEFQEEIPFNVTKKTIKVWGKSTSSSNKAKKTTTKKSSTPSVNSNVKYLLGTCGTMKKGGGSKKCVQSLQKFLQSKGYYKNYKVDGSFGVYTEKAVKSLQKANKLKSTGQWDKATRSYWQKKYKYPVISTTKVGSTSTVYSNNKQANLKKASKNKGTVTPA